MIKIAGLQRVTLLDYPDKIAASVFMAGCNLNCPFCHNRWMINEAEAAEALSLDAFYAFLRTRQGLLDGVCVSGGEPTLQRNLSVMLRQIKALGFLVKLDTNGTLPRRLATVLEEGLVDYVAMDIKAPLDSRYEQQAGCPFPLDNWRRSLSLLRDSAIPYELRTTVAPGLTIDDLVDIADELHPDEPWFLQLYRATEESQAILGDMPVLGEEELLAAREKLAEIRPLVQVRGI